MIRNSVITKLDSFSLLETRYYRLVQEHRRFHKYLNQESNFNPRMLFPISRRSDLEHQFKVL